MIQSLLTTPRQGPGGNGTTTGGGGLAGVATKFKGKGIHVVNDRTKYQEWEFVYDMKKDKSVMGAQGAAANQQMQQQLQQQQQQNPLGSSPSGFGSTPATPTTPPVTPPSGPTSNQ